MPTVPQYNRETRLNGAAKPYIRADVNGDMLGAGSAAALGNLGGALNRLSDAVMHIVDVCSGYKIFCKACKKHFA